MSPNTTYGTVVVGIPRLYAAASLKPPVPEIEAVMHRPYSAALCRGLIEASRAVKSSSRRLRYSAALCRGLIEASGPPAWPMPSLGSIPRLYAAASLKRADRRAGASRLASIPRLYAAASLKPDLGADGVRRESAYSAALCRGLIEAPELLRACFSGPRRIPRLYAAASLKLQHREPPSAVDHGIPRLYAAASLKLDVYVQRIPDAGRIPRLYAAASLKHDGVELLVARELRIPRLYAAASLKPLPVPRARPRGHARYSAALCRGLIEAPPRPSHRASMSPRVFRGSMPRPH